MKIALLQFYSKNPTPVYDELARVLRKHGHTVWVGTPDADGDLAWHNGTAVVHRTRGAGFPTIPLLRPVARRLRYLLFLFRLRKDLRRFRPDIAQVNKTTYGGVLPRFMPAAIRFVYDVRQPGLWAQDTPAGRAANTRVIRRLRRNSRSGYDLACYASEAVASRILGPQWRRWAAITPIGVDPQFLSYRRDEALPEPGTRPVRFLYVGSLLPGKRLEGLLDAARVLRKETRAFQLVLMGPGDESGHYRKIIAAMGLEQQVEIHSPVPYRDVPQVVSGYDVAVAFVPDIEDWLYQVTLKVLEYRALGVPILATDLPPNREIVLDGVNGVLAANAPDEFSQGMKRFVTDPVFLGKCRRQALEMREGRTWEDVARVHEEDVYRRVMKARS
jgi:glycosyltransferase involved in cell wall biosynthesis